MQRPRTTLFMLMSVDGKISTGAVDARDFDLDLPKISGVKEGLSQYYELEKKTDTYSFITGKVMSKVGWNKTKDSITKLPVNFIVVDNKPHLSQKGVNNLIEHGQRVIIVTTNKQHPANHIKNDNLIMIEYAKVIDFKDLLQQIFALGGRKITLQSGSTMNAELIRLGLIDYISVVIAPAIIGGKDTPTLVDGRSLETINDLSMVAPLELISIDKLDDSYLNIKYKVISSK